MPEKPKKNQPETPNNIQLRDKFETPRYATELLIPFIPEHVKTIWEPMCGSGRMVRVFENAGYEVRGTDLATGNNVFDINDVDCDMFGSNPHFSGKKKVWEHLIKFDIPTALLVTADYSGWIINAIKMGAEKIIPDPGRVDYITPNILHLIHQNETLADYNDYNKKMFLPEVKKYKDLPEISKKEYLDAKFHLYDTLELAGNEMIAKHSSSMFHSM